MSVQTQQVLPPGGNACPQLLVSNITPYIQDGALNSFDVTISDASYVAVLGSVGGVGVPFNHISRWNNTDGTLRLHADVPVTPMNSSVPVVLTLLSSPSGKPTCMTQISFVFPGTGPVSTGGNTSGGSNSVNNSGSGVSASPVKPAKPVAGVSSPATTSTSTVVAAPVLARTIADKLQRLCAANGSFQLWFLLITLYLVGVAVVALTQPPLGEKSPWLPATLILVPLALLLAFWLIVPMCKAGGWVPIVLIVMAIVGLFVAYRQRREIARIFQLPPAPIKPPVPAAVKQTVPTPTPAPKAAMITPAPAIPKSIEATSAKK